MRLGVIIGQDERCGIGDFAHNLAEALPQRIECQWIAHPDDPSSRAWRRTAQGADGLDLVHVHFEYGLFESVKPYRNHFATLMERLRPPAVVTLHGPPPELASRWNAGRRGPSDILRDLAYLPFFGKWRRRFLQRATHWIIHNRQLSDQVSAVVGSGRVTYLPLPIPATGRRWRSRKDGSLVLVSPGFVKKHKGYDRFVEVMRDMPSCSWVVAGGPQDQRDDEFLKDLRRMIDDQGIGDQVRITGYLSRAEMEESFCRADMAIFPFHHVAASASMAWAIGCGAPVVATDLPEFLELQSRGAGIEFLPIDAPGSWPEIIQGLGRDRKRLENLSQRNRDFSSVESFTACAAAHTELFERVASTYRIVPK